jgi:hypothetical protein
MASSPRHTPYDGSSKLFTIGLKPIEAADWIEIDEDYEAQLREKRRLYAAHEPLVFVAEPGTQEAQAEVLALLGAHLGAHFPERFRADGLPAAEPPDPAVGDLRAMPPLKAASLLVQEDLILMRRGADGWRLAAGSLCFPSSWVLTEKFGKPLDTIHGPVPGFGPGTRPAALIERMFDNLQGPPVERYNWSIQAGDALYHPLSRVERDDRAVHRPTRFPGGDVAAHAFIRVERQTLRKLPACGDILFTIRIHLDPLRALARHPERARIAISFVAQFEALDQAQLDYKGITADRDRLIGLLRQIAQGA